VKWQTSAANASALHSHTAIELAKNSQVAGDVRTFLAIFFHYQRSPNTISGMPGASGCAQTKKCAKQLMPRAVEGFMAPILGALNGLIRAGSCG
jgi:hypothetical protein